MKEKPDSVTKQRRSSKSSSIDSDERKRRVAEAAYYKAQSRGFAAGNDQRDWFEAEREFDAGKRLNE